MSKEHSRAIPGRKDISNNCKEASVAAQQSEEDGEAIPKQFGACK